jgi:triosephosphate isomerase (TIM)
LIEAVCSGTTAMQGVEVGVFPPFPYIADAARRCAGRGVFVGAQNCHAQPAGAFTGEVAASMLKDVGATHVILGHSERRQFCGEDDAAVREKLAAALAHGLVPIVCVGETLAERQGNRTFDVIRRQLEGALAGFDAAQLAGLVLAYEPVWAIGTGVNATPAQAVEVHRFIRGLCAERFGAKFAAALRIQYGGSVKSENAAELLCQDEIDGALVGGASLEPRSFLSIVQAAKA